MAIPKVILNILFWGALVALVAATSQLAPAQATSASLQKNFPTAQAAADALIKAAADYDNTALIQIFGPQAKEVISSADPVQDKNNISRFVELAREKKAVKEDPADPKRAELIIGNERWPFPVPLLKTKSGWIFDSKSGHAEILRRRIGANELDAIQICRGYVEAQDEYATTIHDNSGVNQYAQKIISTPGKQDGLYWADANGTPSGPIAERAAKAIEEGYSVDRKSPYHGYYFKILKGQGPAAPLGKLDYVIQGAMIGGFALIAFPAQYQVTGIKTFMVSQDGVVYQKDLGPNTLEVASGIELFNPDKTWQPTFDQWPR